MEIWVRLFWNCLYESFTGKGDFDMAPEALAHDKIIRFKIPKIVLEVGVGSGVVLSFARKLIGSSCLYIGTDVNASAVECSQITAEVNKCPVELIHEDLASCLQPRLNGLVDLIIFNPPYVVTNVEELGSQSIEAAWAGGKIGRQVTDKFLPRAAELLSERGLMYLVLIDKNKPDEVLQLMRKFEIDGKIVASRKAGIENLLIVKFWKKQIT